MFPAFSERTGMGWDVVRRFDVAREESLERLLEADRLLMRDTAEAFRRRAVFDSVGIKDVDRVALYGVEAMEVGHLVKAERKLERAVERLVR